MALTGCPIMKPKYQKDLFSILIWFRFSPVALPAGIAKIYNQVKLDNGDKDYYSFPDRGLAVNFRKKCGDML